ncbi:MAG: hypothetical protein Ct9H300mP25_10990 [Acidobacteriota bacterium]|nr:MAG: hypothetical protein Ct9H300mP25_10990 [Acidobacteriota bacterium]
MLAAILGGGVDTDVLPVGVHSVAQLQCLEQIFLHFAWK